MLQSPTWFMILIGVYFRRLKINHDSHDFILESGTVANTDSQKYIYYVVITISKKMIISFFHR